MKREAAIFFLVFLVLALFQISLVNAATADSTQSVNRLRVVMTTTSDWSHLYLPAGESVINWTGSQTSGAAGIATVRSNEIFIAQNVLGRTSSVQFDILVSGGVVSDGMWQISKGWGQRTHVEIYNINDLNNPVLIASQDDTAAKGDFKTFTVSAASESRGGPLAAGGMGPRHVFAFYAPWWNYDSWDNPNKSDSPTSKYYFGNLNDVKHLVDSAAGAGVEGFISSFQGKDYNDGAFRTLLEAARQKGNFKVSSYIETAVANWLIRNPPLPIQHSCVSGSTEVVQSYGTSANYLTYNGKPVIFIYRARMLSPAEWKSQVFDSLRAQGIDAFYMADYMQGDNSYPLLIT